MKSILNCTVYPPVPWPTPLMLKRFPADQWCHLALSNQNEPISNENDHPIKILPKFDCKTSTPLSFTAHVKKISSWPMMPICSINWINFKVSCIRNFTKYETACGTSCILTCLIGLDMIRLFKRMLVNKSQYSMDDFYLFLVIYSLSIYQYYSLSPLYLDCILHSFLWNDPNSKEDDNMQDIIRIPF